MTSATSLLNQIFYPYKKFDATKIHEFGPWMLSNEYLEFIEKHKEEQNVYQSSFESPVQSSDDHVVQSIVFTNEQPILQEDEIENVILLEPIINPRIEPIINPRIEPIINPRIEPIINVNINTPNRSVVNTWFRSSKPDTLFWSIYTAFHGEAAYHIIGNRYRNTEIEEKQKVMEYIKKNADVFRGSVHNVKITKVSVQEILSDLMLNKKTSWLTFVALCYYYKINAIVSYNKTYYEFSTAHGESCYHFTRNQDGHISVDTEPLTEEGASNLRETNVHLDYGHPAKPIKSITSYKVDDLFHMATVLDVVQPPNTKWKKADWFNALVQRCLW